MKRLLNFILLYMCCFLLQAKNHALVIGIGEYPDVDYGWCTINGDNDISIICEMLKVNGFEDKNIVTLRNSEATFSGIIAGLSSLEEELKTDDVVYIHFSGHGQQITDLDSDEKDGYDEAWIPYDALQEPTPYYNGEFHLTDDILNNILHKLKEKVGKNGKIIVVADACHSGTSTRDITDDSIIRGTSAKFIIKSNKNTIKNERSTEWITISACSDNEVNRQCKIGNSTSYGSLSYALYKLRYKLGKLTLSELEATLKGLLQSPLIARPQSPKIEYYGSDTQFLFK